MTIETAREISSNPKLMKRLAKYLAPQCFCNTTLEDLMPALLRTRRPSYCHVVFTIPQQLAPLVLQNQRVCYGLLFRAVSETLQQIAAGRWAIPR
jgi:hypothetical protein